MEDIKSKKVGSLVAEDYKYADIFKKHGIDFCCGGGKSIEEACKNRGVNYGQLVKDLLSVNENSHEINGANEWPLDQLINHIENVHHTYVMENVPLLLEYSNKVAKVHGDRHPETIEINRQLYALVDELLPHLNKEETILFPYILKLIKTNVKAGLSAVQYPIEEMMDEHDTAGEIMKTISELSMGYTPPASACATYRVLYQKLREFENDLHRHIHLENNILFPKALSVEQSL
ncbi:iron-sulfur cluster repair di-iron protein [Fulvivirga sp. 29W222]|uniref:Iron-sulfur cluster repair di-iron protein n=1 Tax=Fulvivirga marina TaxID=2494733 RepID=A0A937KEZ7_9BACT|nr:iron-sulfur cluster repair di-iron protein [Fulvivirga marina]MBL6447725.1 iron-sulfur cluster repair di-iron protein [Fulvivirga marina]